MRALPPILVALALCIVIAAAAQPEPIRREAETQAAETPVTFWDGLGVDCGRQPRSRPASKPASQPATAAADDCAEGRPGESRRSTQEPYNHGDQGSYDWPPDKLNPDGRL